MTHKPGRDTLKASQNICSLTMIHIKMIRLILTHFWDLTVDVTGTELYIMQISNDKICTSVFCHQWWKLLNIRHKYDMIQHCTTDSDSLEWSLTGRFLQGHACTVESLFWMIYVVFSFQNTLQFNIHDAQCKRKERCVMWSRIQPKV